MTRDGRTKTATSSGLVGRRRVFRALRRNANRPMPVGAGAEVTAIVLPPPSLRLGDRLAGRLRLLVLSLQLVGLLLRGELSGEDVLEPLAHLGVEPGRREDVDVVAERAARARRLGEVVEDLLEEWRDIHARRVDRHGRDAVEDRKVPLLDL